MSLAPEAGTGTRPLAFITAEPLDIPHLMGQLCQTGDSGAIASFTGQVRCDGDGSERRALMIEHYPGMTENGLWTIARRTFSERALFHLIVAHRVGPLNPGESIVFVGASSRHRQDALGTVTSVMDYVKTDALIWKKEITLRGEHWVEARKSDADATARHRAGAQNRAVVLKP